MNLREWLDHSEAILSDAPHADRARRDAETLLLHHIGKNKAWLMAHGEENFAGCAAIGYAALVERRRKGEPIQYITGECEFYGLPFHVTPDVLIPRPETEHLVEQALALATQLGAPGLDSETWKSTNPAPPRRILDVGTGSGAIAVALATQLPNAEITAIDISERALSIARENAKRNGAAIRFDQGDLLAPVAGEHFEIIVSNPPYVPNTDRALIAVEVREHEPHVALFGGQDGLEIYRRLIPAAYAALVPGGYLVFEFGFSQMSDIEALLKQSGLQNIEFTRDLQGIPRVASAQRP
ncbi:MAG TPA: peptide chain release factor N(5)-glutamine methyltransferase [Terracidiphilus sp.]|jgi:release factor glutamine methyltransferase